MTGLIQIDLQKAFDTIDHDILLQNMVHLRFSAQTIMCFRSYLTNITFLVNVDKIFSDPGKLKCGVPLGSILGPLLFLLMSLGSFASVCAILFFRLLFFSFWMVAMISFPVYGSGSSSP